MPLGSRNPSRRSRGGGSRGTRSLWFPPRESEGNHEERAPAWTRGWRHTADPGSAKLKICLVGDEGVGKTSLVRRFVLSEFSERYVRTVGVVIHKRVVYLGPIGGRTYEATLTIWDILGREEFASQYGKAYLSNVAGILSVCDLTRRETLDGLERWLQLVRTSARVPAIVLANKIDATDRIRVSHPELAALCKRHGVSFLETSAKTGQNVGVAFSRLAEAALRNALASLPSAVGLREESADGRVA